MFKNKIHLNKVKLFFFIFLLYALRNICCIFSLEDSSFRQRLVRATQLEQIHLSFGDKAQDIVVMWATRRNEVFQIELAESAESIKKIDCERTVLDIESSNHAAKYLHRAYLADLKPGENYVYRIVGKSGIISNAFTFRVPNNTTGKVHIFMILADMGLKSKNLKFLTYEAAIGMYEAVFHIGDIAYSLHYEDGNIGDQFLRHMENFAAHVPYMTVPGDNDKYSDFAHYR